MAVSKAHLGILGLSVGKVSLGVVILDPVLEGVGLGCLVLQGDGGIGRCHGLGLDIDNDAGEGTEKSGDLRK